MTLSRATHSEHEVQGSGKLEGLWAGRTLLSFPVLWGDLVLGRKFRTGAPRLLSSVVSV